MKWIVQRRKTVVEEVTVTWESSPSRAFESAMNSYSWNSVKGENEAEYTYTMRPAKQGE